MTISRPYISNNCANLSFYFTENREYDHPFIGCLFVNDEQYVKFCSNFSDYISTSPIFGEPRKDSKWAKQNGSPWYNHKEIQIPYPVMYLGDVEIHWIHEKSREELMEKYTRRLDRFFKRDKTELVQEPIFLLSCSDFCNDHTEQEYNNMIKDFLKLTTAIYLTREKKDLLVNKKATEEGRVEFIERWVGKGDKRNESHILDIHTVGDRLVDFKRVCYKLFKRENGDKKI